jgi:fibronectin type 3 domain-containing protein
VPQNVSATAVVGSIKLAWSPPSSDGGALIANYRIYRGTTSGGESLLTTVGNTTSYADSAVTAGSSYFYRVAAVNSVGEGPQSAEVSAAPITVTVPGPPQNLTAAAAKPRGVGMSWSAPASNGGSTITGYRVYRSTASGQETLLTTVGVVTSYTDTSTTSGVRYYYKVLAFSSAGDGALSNEATAIAR